MPACVLHIKLIVLFCTYYSNVNINLLLYKGILSIKDVIRVDLNERFQPSHILNLQVHLLYISYLHLDYYLLIFSLYKVSTAVFDDGVCLT